MQCFLHSSLHAMQVTVYQLFCSMVFWLFEEFKPHYITNIFHLCLQLMRMQSGAEITVSTVIEIKPTEVLKMYVYLNI